MRTSGISRAMFALSPKAGVSGLSYHPGASRTAVPWHCQPPQLQPVRRGPYGVDFSFRTVFGRIFRPELF
jgi:hypothetical protein